MKTVKNLKNFLALVPDDAQLKIFLKVPGYRYNAIVKGFIYDGSENTLTLASAKDHLFNLQSSDSEQKLSDSNHNLPAGIQDSGIKVS
jgi:hypothetical protein